MIVTSINSPDCALYEKTHKYFAEAFELARKVINDIPEDGKYFVDGDNYFYMIQSYKAKDPSAVTFESHREYIDIQIVLRGEEEIRVEAMDGLTCCKEYAPDCERFSMNDKYDSVRVCAGEAVILFPNEPHAPGVRAVGGGGDVRKLVVKIRRS